MSESQEATALRERWLAYLIEGILLVVLGATAWSLIARNRTNRFDASACWLELQKMWKDKCSPPCLGRDNDERFCCGA